MANRPIITRKPGTLLSKQDEATDDLSEFEDGSPLPAVDPVQAQMAEMQAEINRLKRRSQPEPSKPTVREPEMTVAEAEAYCQAQVAQGIRPRAILTPEGWYTHREMARGPGSVGNASTMQA